MAARSYSVTSESVTEGHPDKVADQVSDAVLDAVLTDDPMGRVACETFITTGLVVVGGEITTEDLRRHPEARPRDGRRRSATRAPKYGFDAETCGVIVAIDEQSPDIAQGVDEAFEVQHDANDDDPLDRIGAGDQGFMFGYATTGDARADAAADHARALARARARGRPQARRSCRTCGPTGRRR